MKTSPKAQRIAIFRADELSLPLINPIFQRQTYQLWPVSAPDEIAQIQEREGVSLDAVIIPLSLADRGSGVAMCLEVRGDHRLRTAPILGLALTKDRAALASFFNAGADVVITPPFDAELIYLQVGALSRQRRSLERARRRTEELVGIRQSMESAFNSILEGLVLTDPDFQIVFANRAARTILGLGDELTDVEQAKLAPQFAGFSRELAANAEARARRGEQEGSALHPLAVNLMRVDDQGFRAAVRCAALSERDGHAAGYAFALADLSEIDHLSQSLEQAERTRSLTLVLAAACMKALDASDLGTPATPLKRIDKLMSDDPPGASVGGTLTSVLELVDLISNPGTSIQVSVTDDWRVDMPRGELFRLLGHIILYAVELAGPSGETVLTAHASENHTVTLEARVTLGRVRSGMPGSYMADVLDQYLAKLAAPNENDGGLSFGMTAARAVTQRHDAIIEQRRISDDEYGLRVQLKLSQPAPVETPAAP